MKSNKQFFKYGNRSIRFLFLSLFFFSTFISIAQVNVTGKVVDTSGEELIGVNVIIKNTNQGTVTDVNGVFTIVVPNLNSTLVFTYVGFEKLETPLNGRNRINVVLSPDIELLDEVIVIGYGTQRRASVTGAVSTLSDTELIKAPLVGITNVLGARTAGVTMLQQTGQPGQDAASLLVRGEGATYIVDGVQRSINEIDPNEIESISVLKDATSASVYGLNATSVIIVTTKRGAEERLGIKYSGSYGISQNAKQIKWLDAPGYAYWYNLARELDGDEPVFTSEQVEKMRKRLDGWGNTNWYDEVFGRGSTTNHNVSATGGNDKVKFFSSIGGFQQKGNVDNFDYNRYSARANIDAELTDHLTMTMSV